LPGPQWISKQSWRSIANKRVNGAEKPMPAENAPKASGLAESRGLCAPHRGRFSAKEPAKSVSFAAHLGLENMFASSLASASSNGKSPILTAIYGHQGAG
jgi:hypothetical protein